MQNYQCHVILDNKSTHHLRLLKNALKWGEFAEGPEEDIGPRKSMKAFVARGATGLSGCEGTLTYQLGDDANNTISIYWDVPTSPWSSNTIKVDASDEDVAAMMSGFKGDGNIESVTIKIVSA